MNRRRLLWQVAAVAVSLLLSSAVAGQVVPPEVVDGLGRLRAAWPEVPGAEMRPGRRFEFRDGAIRVGEETLRDLARDPANANGAILTFLLAHEGWHSVQYGRYSPADITRFKENRMLECEADFMGAAATYRLMVAAGATPATLALSRRAISDYLRLRSGGVGGAAAYPPPEARALTAQIGWAAARTPELFRDGEGQPRPPMAEAARAADICTRITHASDPSLGTVDMNWERTGSPPTADTPESQMLTLRNRSARPVTVRFLVLSSNMPYADGDNYESRDLTEVFHVLDETVTVPANQSVTRTYALPPKSEHGDHEFPIRSLPRVSGASSSLVATQYADLQDTPLPYCVDRIAEAPPGAGRALLARLGTLALAAEDDFRPIMGREAYDTDGGWRTVVVMPALNPDGRSQIYQPPSSSGSWLSMQAFASEEEATVTAEYERLKQLLVGLCGAANLRPEPLTAGQDPGEQGFELVQFAPRARVRMSVTLWRTYYLRQNMDPVGQLRGGHISFAIDRKSVN